MSENAGNRTFYAYEALAVSRRVKLKSGTTTTPPEVEYADAGEQHIGTTLFAAGAGEPVTIRLANCSGTIEMESAEAFAVGAPLYGAADGKVADTAVGSAIGIAIEAAGSAGALVECAPFVVLSTTAATVSLADAGGLTEAATVEAALTEIYTNAKSAAAAVPIALGALTMEDGTILTKQATTVAGLVQLSNKEQAIQIPIDCTAGEALAFCVPLPQDFSAAGNMSVHVLAGKGGDLDVLTLAAELYLSAAGDTGNTNAVTTAAQTITAAVSELVFVAPLAGLIAGPAIATVVLSLGGTNDGDAVNIYGVWIEYTRTVLAA